MKKNQYNFMETIKHTMRKINKGNALRLRWSPSWEVRSLLMELSSNQYTYNMENKAQRWVFLKELEYVIKELEKEVTTGYDKHDIAMLRVVFDWLFTNSRKVA